MSEEALRLDAVAARVAAWHNRHPLARRIQASQVGHVGVVTLPFLVPGAGAMPGAAAEPVSTQVEEQPAGRWARLLSLRLRLKFPVRLLRRGSSRLQPAFDEDFLPPWQPAALARWAARHGDPGAAPSPDILLRVVPASTDPMLPTRTIGVASAAIDLGALKSRVLIGRGPRAAILGRRLWSPVRMGVAALALTTLMGGGLAALQIRQEPVAALHAATTLPPDTAPVLVAGSAVSASAPPLSVSSDVGAPAQQRTQPQQVIVDTDSQGAPAMVVVAASEPAAVHSLPTLPLPETPPRGSPPPPAPRSQAASTRSLGSAAPRPAIRPILDDDSKAAARDAVAVARQALGLPEPLAASAATPAAARSTGSAALAAATQSTVPAAKGMGAGMAVVASLPAFALSTRALRTRAEADQVMAAARALLAAMRTTGSAALQVEVLPVGEDWRVAAFPYERRADAERAVALLASRGMRVTVVDF